jgi:RNA polymerase sigma factor (sigma-70 family)
MMPAMGDDFGSTHWSLVLEAARGDSERARAALIALCNSYREPLYRYALRRSKDAEAANDATQEFFARQVVTGAIFKRAAPDHGRFREWLMAAMRNHLHNVADRERAQKRGGGTSAVALDDLKADEPAWAGPAEHDAHFDRAWAMNVLGRARKLLEQRYADRPELFGVLQKFLPGDEGSYVEAAKQLGKSQGATKTQVSRFRDEFGEAVRAEILRTVSSPAKVDEEIRALIAAVSGNP